jgi:hypothetical protein
MSWGGAEGWCRCTHDTRCAQNRHETIDSVPRGSHHYCSSPRAKNWSWISLSWLVRQSTAVFFTWHVAPCPTTLQLKVVSGNNGIQSGNNVRGGMDPPSKRCSNTPLPQTNVSHAITHVKTTATPHKKMAHKKSGVSSHQKISRWGVPYSP